MPVDKPEPNTDPTLRRSLIGALTLLAALVVLPCPVPAADAPGGDPRALEVADRLLEALGGAEAWESTRYIEFRFFDRRDHVWDRWTGRHRVEGQTRKGQAYVVLHDVHDEGQGEGRAFLAGEEVDGEQRADLLKLAYQTWVNDTYWLLMPYKLHDPGVYLRYEGEEQLDGETYDVLRLSFEGVGLTPGDRYWAYVNRDTGLMDRWAFHLEGMGPDDDPSQWLWLGWDRHGEILLAPTRRQVGGEERELSLAPIQVHDEVPERVFTEP